MFKANPRSLHKHAMLRIERYLMKTKDMGIVLKLNNMSMELWCDIHFCGIGTQTRYIIIMQDARSFVYQRYKHKP